MSGTNSISKQATPLEQNGLAPLDTNNNGLIEPKELTTENDWIVLLTSLANSLTPDTKQITPSTHTIYEQLDNNVKQSLQSLLRNAVANPAGAMATNLKDQWQITPAIAKTLLETFQSANEFQLTAYASANMASTKYNGNSGDSYTYEGRQDSQMLSVGVTAEYIIKGPLADVSMAGSLNQDMAQGNTELSASEGEQTFTADPSTANQGLTTAGAQLAYTSVNHNYSLTGSRGWGTNGTNFLPTSSALLYGTEADQFGAWTTNTTASIQSTAYEPDQTLYTGSSSNSQAASLETGIDHRSPTAGHWGLVAQGQQASSESSWFAQNTHNARATLYLGHGDSGDPLVVSAGLVGEARSEQYSMVEGSQTVMDGYDARGAGLSASANLGQLVTAQGIAAVLANPAGENVLSYSGSLGIGNTNNGLSASVSGTRGPIDATTSSVQGQGTIPLGARFFVTGNGSYASSSVSSDLVAYKQTTGAGNVGTGVQLGRQGHTKATLSAGASKTGYTADGSDVQSHSANATFGLQQEF